MSDEHEQRSTHRFLVDENLPPELAERLVNSGYAATHVYLIVLRGRPDEEVYARAQQEKLTIITGDLGFGNPYQYALPHAGVIVARLPDALTIDRRIAIILEAIRSLDDRSLENAVVTVEVGRLRIRQQ